MRRPRVAIDIRPLAEGKSGVATYLRNLIPAMVEVGSVDLVLFFDSSHTPSLLETLPPGNWRAVPVPHAPEQVWEQLAVPLAVRRLGIDIFHRPHGAGGMMLGPVAGSRQIVTVHDVIPLLYPQEYFRNRMHRRYFSLLLAVSRRADAVITVSEAAKQDLVERARFEPSKVTVIYEAVDEAFLNGADREATGVGPGPYLLAMGPGEPRKNLARVVEAFSAIADRIPHRLVVVGAPWRGRRLALPSSPDVSTRVVELGAVADAQLRTLYRDAAAFVYPSLAEGFGLPVLEAMAAQTPVVTSQEGSLPEVAGAAAVYVNAHDPSSIANGILEVLNNEPRRQSLVAAGAARLALFSWKTAARETLEIYQRVLG